MEESIYRPLEWKPLEGTEFLVHPQSNSEKGGFYMKDEGGIIPAAIKDITGKIAERTMKGELAEMHRIPMPSFIHMHISQLNLQQNDMLNS